MGPPLEVAEKCRLLVNVLQELKAQGKKIEYVDTVSYTHLELWGHIFGLYPDERRGFIEYFPVYDFEMTKENAHRFFHGFMGF